MFRSKSRPVAIPQSEHLRIVGTLALLWGNEEFEVPAAARGSLVAGMGLHDRGYGAIDNSPIGGMTDEEWEAIARRSFYEEFGDPVADLIAKYHVRRLVSLGSSPGRRRMAEEFARVIEATISAGRHSTELFDRIDRMTNLCDRISFDFCFGEPAAGSLPVYRRAGDEEPVEVSYRIEGERITLVPWPLSVDHHRSYIIGYHAEGYPERLDPVILPYLLARA